MENTKEDIKCAGEHNYVLLDYELVRSQMGGKIHYKLYLFCTKCGVIKKQVIKE